LPGCQLLVRSRWYATVPIGGIDGQNAFLNGALLVETTLQPAELASSLQEIETSLGRERIIRWDARTIDIDILLYGTAVIDTSELTLPHPRMGFRLFVLEPAAEIAGEMLHPTSGWTLAGLLAHLRNSPRYVTITAAEQPIADWLAMHLNQTLGCPVWPAAQENSAQENIVGASVLQPAGGVEFSATRCGEPPIVATMPADAMPAATLDTLTAAKPKEKKFARPALVIALDVANLGNLRKAAEAAGFVGDKKAKMPSAAWLNPLGMGPLARITADDPAIVLQETLAAVRCVWPDID